MTYLRTLWQFAARPKDTQMETTVSRLHRNLEVLLQRRKNALTAGVPTMPECCDQGDGTILYLEADGRALLIRGTFEQIGYYPEGAGVEPEVLYDYSGKEVWRRPASAARIRAQQAAIDNGTVHFGSEAWK